MLERWEVAARTSTSPTHVPSDLSGCFYSHSEPFDCRTRGCDSRDGRPNLLPCAMSRLYDPQNPRFLSREEVARLNPAACAAACEELDQNILSTLQNIDANFVETTRIVTDVILPTAERYGRSSKQIWDSIKVGDGFVVWKDAITVC